jgi:FlaG/FlaF family flagellin (archaellin)
MKSLIVSLVFGASALVPAFAFAQASNAPVTRAEVRADLVRLEQAGYQPALIDNATYPADIQAAEAKVAAEQDAQHTAAQGYGGSQQGSSAAGASTARVTVAAGNCVGPRSFCNLYAGG